MRIKSKLEQSWDGVATSPTIAIERGAFGSLSTKVTNFTYIGMEFGIEWYDKLINYIRKREITEGIEQPNKKRIRTVGEKETYKYWKYWKRMPSNKRKWKK